MSAVRRLSTSVLLATIALIVLLGAKPIATATILAGYALTLAAIAMGGLTSAMQAARAGAPSRFEAELARERVAPSRPPDLVRAERELVLAASDPHHFRRRLQPLLCEIASARGGDQQFDADAPTMRDLRAMIDELEALR